MDFATGQSNVNGSDLPAHQHSSLSTSLMFLQIQLLSWKPFVFLYVFEEIGHVYKSRMCSAYIGLYA